MRFLSRLTSCNRNSILADTVDENYLSSHVVLLDMLSANDVVITMYLVSTTRIQ
jgi:hypothetical protein